VVRRFAAAGGAAAARRAADPASNGARATDGDAAGDAWDGQIIGRVVGVYRRVAEPDKAD